MMPRRVTGAVVGAALLCTPGVWAQEVDDATRASARQLGYSGVEAFEAQNYTVASDKLERAYRVLQVPTLGLWSARALAKLGKLVQAQERYFKVGRLPIGGGDADVQSKAQADAATELAALLPRIPSVEIELQGADAAEVSLSLDGTPVSSALVGVPRPVDPGAHTLVGTRGAERQQVSFTVAEAAHPHVALTFAPGGAAASPVDATTPGPGEAASDRPRSTQRTWGWVTVGVGAAGLVFGGVTGGLVLSKKSDFDAEHHCNDSACGPSQQSNVDSYNSMRTLSTVGFIAGGVVAATGIVILLTAPSQKPASTTALWVGASGAGVRGSF